MNNLEVYDSLRKIHRLLFDLMEEHNFDEWDDRQKLPIEAISSVLYLAEADYVRKDNE